MVSTLRVYSENTRIDLLFNKKIDWNRECLHIFEEYFEKNLSVWICLSWWPDSIFLLMHYIEFAKRNKIEYKKLCTVFHYMHHVRNDDYIDFDFIQSVSSSLWIKLVVASYVWNDFREEILRDARRNRIDNVSKTTWIKQIVSWHTLDDRIETSLLNGIRGCNEFGWWGMPLFSKRQNKTITYLRPLLSIRKSEIESFLHTYTIPHLIDPTNTDKTISERNRIRSVLDKEDIGIYTSLWRNKLYSLLEQKNTSTYELIDCDIHPDRWEWVLIQLSWVRGSTISLQQLCELLWVRFSYAYADTTVWKWFIATHGFWYFKAWDNRCVKTNNKIYYTTLAKDFWKNKSYTFDRCLWTWWVQWVDNYKFQNISFKKRVKSIPVFRRNCLPVIVENNTVQEIYSLIR